MSGTARRLSLLAPLMLTGCFHLPGRLCLTPPYDAPAGFSETYHAALARQEPILHAGDALYPYPAEGHVVGPPLFLWPGAAISGDPPLDW